MPEQQYGELGALLRKQTDLLAENNRLLKKIHRYNVIAGWLKFLWIIILIGLPFALYVFLEPYFEAFDASFEQFQAGMHEIPGIKVLEQLIDSGAVSEESIE